MKFGDTDGLNKIYLESGEIITNSEEQITHHFKGEAKSWVVPTKRGLSVVNRIFFKGTFYLTNQRIVFIADPHRVTAGMNAVYGASNLSTNYQYVMARANVAYKSGCRMYFYFLPKEIKNIKGGLLSIIVKLKESSERSIRIAVDKKSGTKIKQYLRQSMI
jgi:hypothetical protein